MGGRMSRRGVVCGWANERWVGGSVPWYGLKSMGESQGWPSKKQVFGNGAGGANVRHPGPTDHYHGSSAKRISSKSDL